MSFLEIRRVVSGVDSLMRLGGWMECCIYVRRSCAGRVMSSYSTHASDTMVLPCEGRNLRRACSKICEKFWYWLMMRSRGISWARHPIDLPRSVSSHPSRPFQSQFTWFAYVVWCVAAGKTLQFTWATVHLPNSLFCHCSLRRCRALTKFPLAQLVRDRSALFDFSPSTIGSVRYFVCTTGLRSIRSLWLKLTDGRFCQSFYS